MATEKNLYTKAHLIVAAIRVLEHTRDIPPSVENICDLLSYSLEEGGRLCRRLEDLEVIKVVEGAFGTKLYIDNHLLIEDIPREEKESRLDEELKKFKDSQKQISQKIESIKAEQSQKKQDLFEKLNQQLQKNLDEK
jgi:hypothetical protein